MRTWMARRSWGGGILALLLLLAMIPVRPALSEIFPKEYLDGFNALKAGKLAQAVRLMERVVQAMPDSAAIHSDLGSAYYFQGKLARASREFTAASKLDPGEAIYHNNLASALIRQQQLKQALESVQTALRLRSDFQDAILNRGVILLIQNRFAEAEKIFRKVSDPKLRALSNLALAQYQQAKWDEALRSVDRALAQYKDPGEQRSLQLFRRQILQARPAPGGDLIGLSLAVKGGYVDRQVSSEYFDSTAAIGAFDAKDFNSVSYESEAAYRFHKHFSLSGTFGYFGGQQTNLNKTTTTGVLLDGDVKFKTFYGLVTAKVHWPIKRFDFYAGLGLGWYNLNREVKLANGVSQVANQASENRNFSNVGYHGVGGGAFNISSRVFLLGELRDFYAVFDTNTNARDDKLNLGPFMYLGGLGVRF
ncbi:MAG: tetratricopeptide repeat protein [Nitrospinota bacterium]|nr:tetratricopeptide repeat protein [Nitrospinota bacterium]MDP7372163.1 tetratricopeptide repeat protein [Nitrospinota bacterium]